jgi:NADH:ubiquinone reductase (H+-translocating)
MAVVNIPETDKERIVIIGAGFAGLRLARKLAKKNYQVVVFDKNNYHQFQPLLYQVAMSGLEPSSIAFPLRKLFQKRKNVHIRIAEVSKILPDEKAIITSIGRCNFDKLVIATGATTNFYGNESIESQSYSLKSIEESMYLRNQILTDFEKALITRDYDDRQTYIDTVIVGGGPTGVELAGALAEMKKFVLPKDYPELNVDEIDIYLIQAGPQLLPGMSEKSGLAAKNFLENLGVKVLLNTRVTSIEKKVVFTNIGQQIHAGKVIWAAGIKGNYPDGISMDCIGGGNRIVVDEFHRVKGFDYIFAIGDIALMTSEKYPYGHPQVAQTAIQQADNLAKNFINRKNIRFVYKDKGSMATIGRNRAVVDLPGFHFSGFFAWIVWLIVHLLAIIGVRNRLLVMINWFWNYFTYDQSLRLILRAKRRS